MEDKNQIIDQCIAKVKAAIRPNCDDHTPYRGACVSCGQYGNPDIIPDIDGLISDLEKLKVIEE